MTVSCFGQSYHKTPTSKKQAHQGKDWIKNSESQKGCRTNRHARIDGRSSCLSFWAQCPRREQHHHQCHLPNKGPQYRENNVNYCQHYVCTQRLQQNNQFKWPWQLLNIKHTCCDPNWIHGKVSYCLGCLIWFCVSSSSSHCQNERIKGVIVSVICTAIFTPECIVLGRN